MYEYYLKLSKDTLYEYIDGDVYLGIVLPLAAFSAICECLYRAIFLWCSEQMAQRIRYDILRIQVGKMQKWKGK